MHQTNNIIEKWNAFLEGKVCKHYSPGEVIYWQHDSGHGVALVKRGIVKDIMLLPDGTEKIYFIAEAPFMSGERTIWKGNNYFCTCIALTKTEIVWLSKEEFINTFLTNPELVAMLMDITFRKVTGLQTQAEESFITVPRRLARLLLDGSKYGLLVEKQNDSCLNITHKELASFMGTTRPQITKCLNRFERQGFIKKNRGNISIKNYEALKSIAFFDKAQ